LIDHGLRIEEVKSGGVDLSDTASPSATELRGVRRAVECEWISKAYFIASPHFGAVSLF